MPDDFGRSLAERYELLRELGQGGMATVYLARDVRHNRQVALKVLHPELSAVLGPERFLKEIALTASLQHPHILPLFDSGEVGGQLFYVMPYVEGETLRGRLERETQLPIDDAIKLAREVADALQYAHASGVVHRDIKPENILLQGGAGAQHALVADFGIALAVQQAGGSRMTQTGLSLGTPQYMAPEQAMGEKTIDARADVYALGAVTYEMLAGEPPFSGPSSQALIAKIMSTEPQRVDVLRRNVSAHVADAVHHALEKLPADRCPTAAQFAAMLGGEGIAPSRTGRLSKTSSDSRGGALPARARWWPALAAASTLTAVALAASLALRETPTASGGAAGLFTVDLPDSTRIAAGGGWKVAISPDGRHVAAILEGGGSTLRRLFLRRTDEAALRPVPGTDGASTPAFSADGRQLAYNRLGGVHVIPVDGGASVRVADAGYQPSWIDDGRLLFVRDSILGLVTPGQAPTSFTPTLDGRAVRASFPSALPGGRHALVAIAPAGPSSGMLIDALRIGVVELATGTVSPLDLAGSNARYVASGHLLFGRRDGLYAVAFDARSRRLIGTPSRILEGVAFAAGGAISYGVSNQGTVVHQTVDMVVTNARDALVRYDLTGRATELTDAGGVFRDMRISPDGQRAVLRRDPSPDRGDLWIYEFATGSFTRLTDDSSSFRGEWSADGRRVIHLQLVRNDSVHVRSRAWDRAGPDSILLRTRFDAGASGKGFGFQSLSLARSGDRVAVRVGGTGNNPDIYTSSLRDLRARQPLAVAATRAREMHPAISPDGRWIAYHSNESGANEVYVTAFDGTGPRAQVSVRGGVDPLWFPNGRQLLFRAPGHFVRATVNTAPLTIGARDSLAPDPYYRNDGVTTYDLFSDGNSVLVTTVNADGRATDRYLRVLTNWTARLPAAGGGR